MPHPPPQKSKSFLVLFFKKEQTFPLAITALYVLLLLPILARAHFDFSIFIVAGDTFANPAILRPPIHVQPHSTGFDGQFYYRAALAPFDLRKTAHGITIDDPALRLQRLFYPLLAWLLACGQARLVPAALITVNLLGIAGIAVTTSRLARRLRLSPFLPAAMLLWPGFIITLTHDTTEIISLLCLLLLLQAVLADCLIILALAGAAAALTRETALPVLAGLTLLAAWRLTRAEPKPRDWARLTATLAAFVPFLAWQILLRRALGHAAFATDAAANIGWPFLGAAQALYETFTGARAYVHSHIFSLALRALVLVTAPLLLALCFLMSRRVPAALRDPDGRVLAASWVLLAATMMLLTGPWIDPVSYFRAFTECFGIGLLLLARAPLPRWLNQIYTTAGAATAGASWGLCVMALR